jgi:hypothetical protein
MIHSRRAEMTQVDYQKLIRSRAVRIRLLQLCSFIPDRAMVKLQYRIKTGRRLNLTDPKRNTEKIQLYKLDYRDARMQRCADKFDMRAYAAQCGYADFLNRCYGVFDSPDALDFGRLPDSFVLKDTLGSGGNAVILVPDKSAVDEGKIRAQMQNGSPDPKKSGIPARVGL